MTPRKPPSEDQLREAISEVGDALQRAVVLSSDRVQSVFEDAVLRGRMTRRDAEELASSLVALGRDQALELRSEVDALARTIPSKVAEAVDPRTKRRRKKARDEAQDESRREAARFVTAEAFAGKAKRSETEPAAAAASKSAPPTAKPTPSKPKTASPKTARAKATPGSRKTPQSAVPTALPSDPAAHTAKDLVALVATLTPADLATLREREAAGKSRATVLRAIDGRAGA